MCSIQFRRAYACARLNLPLSDDLASIAAIIAAQDRRKRDGINDRLMVFAASITYNPR